MKIKIDSYSKFPEGKVKGICNISLEVADLPQNICHLTINGVKIIDNSQGGRFYAMPTREYVDKGTGEKKYASVCAFFTKEGYQSFRAAMDEAFSVYFRDNPPPINAEKVSKPQQQIPIPQPQSIPSSFDDDLPF